MKGTLIILSLFFTINCIGQSVDSLANRLIDNLREEKYELIIEHRLWLFNGRFSIYHKDKNLNCDGAPGVFHIFWVGNGRMKCQRIDPCGYFEPIKVINFISKQKIQKLKKDSITFKKYSPHFNSHNLIIYDGDEILEWNLTGKQLKNQPGDVVRMMKKIEKIIRKKVNSGAFTRM